MSERVAQATLENWLLDNRWPNAYDLSHALMKSNWLAAHDDEVRAETYRAAADLVATYEEPSPLGYRHITAVLQERAYRLTRKADR